MSDTSEKNSEKKAFSVTTCMLTSGICLLPVALGFVLWDKLPEQIPQQYGWNGQVNWTLPKPIGFILCPVILVLANAVLLTAPLLAKKRLNRKIELLLCWLIPVISLIVNSLLLLKAAGMDIDIVSAVIALLSLMFIVIGNYLPKTEPNSVVGIRAPWINNNPDVWAKTNRLGGILFVAAGIACFISCFTPAGKYVFIISLSLVAIISFVYSIVLAVHSRKAVQEDSATV